MKRLPTSSGLTSWHLKRAAQEFGVSPDTLSRKLREAGHEVDGRKLWTARQCCEALRGTGDREAVRYRKDLAEAEIAEMEAAKMRMELVDLAEVVDYLNTRMCGPLRTRILSMAATLGQAANPSDPVHGQAAVNRWIDTLFPLCRDITIEAFRDAPIETDQDESQGEPEE